jgi:hypothetical protein
MTHERQDIRDAIVLALTGLVTTGSNVISSNVYPIADDQLPALSIYTLSETSNVVSKSSSGAILERSVEFVVTAYVKASSNYDSIIDTILQEVEQALEEDNTVNSLVQFIYPTDLNIDISDEGNKPIAIAAQGFRLQYRTNLNPTGGAVIPSIIKFRSGISYNKDNIEDIFHVTTGNYQNIFRSYYQGKVEHYFSCIAMSIIAEEFTGTSNANKLLDNIKAVLNKVIMPRLSAKPYVSGGLFHEADFVWEVTTGGTTDATTAFTGSYEIGDFVTDGDMIATAVMPHITGHIAYLTSTLDDLSGYSYIDGNSEIQFTKQDSDDATAAGLFMEIDRYVALNDASFLDGASDNAERSFKAILDEMYVNNIKDQIVENNLAYVFQSGTDPITGGASDARYSADNAENLGGVKALYRIYDAYGDIDRKGWANSDTTTLTTGLLALWSVDHFLVSDGDDQSDTSEGYKIASWYAQAIVMFYLEDDDLTADQRIKATNYMNNKIPNWWKDTSYTPHLSLMPLYYEYKKGGDYAKVQEAIYVLEKIYFPTVTPYLNIMDLVIYIVIKNGLMKKGV